MQKRIRHLKIDAYSIMRMPITIEIHNGGEIINVYFDSATNIYVISIIEPVEAVTTITAELMLATENSVINALCVFVNGTTVNIEWKYICSFKQNMIKGFRMVDVFVLYR